MLPALEPRGLVETITKVVNVKDLQGRSLGRPDTGPYILATKIVPVVMVEDSYTHVIRATKATDLSFFQDMCSKVPGFYTCLVDPKVIDGLCPPCVEVDGTVHNVALFYDPAVKLDRYRTFTDDNFCDLGRDEARSEIVKHFGQAMKFIDVIVTNSALTPGDWLHGIRMFDCVESGFSPDLSFYSEPNGCTCDSRFCKCLNIALPMIEDALEWVFDVDEMWADHNEPSRLDMEMFKALKSQVNSAYKMMETSDKESLFKILARTIQSTIRVITTAMPGGPFTLFSSDLPIVVIDLSAETDAAFAAPAAAAAGAAAGAAAAGSL